MCLSEAIGLGAQQLSLLSRGLTPVRSRGDSHAQGGGGRRHPSLSFTPDRDCPAEREEQKKKKKRTKNISICKVKWESDGAGGWGSRECVLA